MVRRLYGRLLDTLLATWGVAILIQQAVRLELGLSFFGIHIQGLGPGLQNVRVPGVDAGTVVDRRRRHQHLPRCSSSWSPPI